MFDKDYKITGKHANYWKDLCELAGNVPDRDQHANFKIFRAYVDAYVTCPIIGFVYNRKGRIDNSVQGDAGMLAAAVIKHAQELKYAGCEGGRISKSSMRCCPTTVDLLSK